MFDAVRNNPKIVQIFLAVITLPFAFFGIDAYFRNGGPSGDVVAKVGKVEISSYALDQAVREQENTLRQQLGDAFDKSFTDNPAFRTAVLDRLINEAAVKAAISEGKLVVSAESIQDYIKQIPEFQENGHFSYPLYEAFVNNQGYTPQGFEQRIRESVAQQQLMMPIAGSGLTSRPVAERVLALEGEKRSVAELRFQAASYLPRVQLAADAARKYYDAHQDMFRSPELAKLEYVVLSQAEIEQKVTVTEADAKKWFDENPKNFAASEERRASHILVQLPEGAKDDVKAAARKKAEDLLAKVKANPASFAEIAKKNSDDPGSAEKGGDLGFIGHGAMVKPFEDAVFALKPHEISGIVESEFGYHIIMLTDIRGNKAKTFDEVKAEAMAGARKQAANLKFAEESEQFGNMVYEQPDSLKPEADKFGLKLVQTDWIARSALPAVLQSPKLQTVLFGKDSIQSRRNSEAVDLGNGSIVSARIVDYKAAAVKPFEEVSKQAEEAARSEEATRLAVADGEAALKKLQAGEAVAGNWAAARELKRSSSELSNEARVAIFAADAAKLPAYVGARQGGDFTLFRIEKVDLPKVAADAPELKDIERRLTRIAGQEDLRAYIEAVRTRVGVQLRKTNKEAATQ